MSLRNMEVQYVGDTLYLPPSEREVKHIVVRNVDVDDWVRYEPIVRCKDCMYVCNHEHANGTEWKTCSYFDSEYAEVEPDGFCAWGERVSE